MYVCMYVCMYVRTYVRMHVVMYIGIYVCMHARMHVCMHACKYVCVPMVYACMHACMHACLYVCMYVRNVCMGVFRFVFHLAAVQVGLGVHTGLCSCVERRTTNLFGCQASRVLGFSGDRHARVLIHVQVHYFLVQGREGWRWSERKSHEQLEIGGDTAEGDERVREAETEADRRTDSPTYQQPQMYRHWSPEIHR